MTMAEFLGNGDQQVRNGTHTVRFGAFEADLHSGEVRKSGARIKLQEQPFKVLQILLEHPGALVTRDELQARIWPTDNFGDFDHAVNVAVGKLRTALGDTADNPCFIETVPRRGYRFVAKLDEAPVEPSAGATNGVSLATAVAPGVPTVGADPSVPTTRAKRAILIVLAIAGAAILVGLGVLLGHRTTHMQPPEFQRLTVQHGTVDSARFTPDGHSVLYAASWDGAPVEIFSTDLKSTGARKMEMPDTALLAVSSASEIAVLQNADPRFMLTMRGTLARVPITGGSPRQISEKVEWADWAPDGKTLAVVRDMGAKRRLEFPLWHVLYETNGWISHPRISPKGDTIAFLDHPSPDDDQGIVSLIDLAGHKTVLSTGWESEEGLAWSPDGTEVWFSATKAGLERRIYAVDLAGHQRLAYQALGGVTLQDIAPDGRVLLTRDENRAGMVGMAAGATKEQDLSWLDWSLPVDLSRDGKTLVFDEEGEQSGPTYTVATRSMQGTPPIPLGEGVAGDLSPDGKWAATVVSYTQIMLLPTGAGMVKRIERGPMQQYGHQIHWLADGKQIVFPGNLPGQATRCFIQNIDGGAPRPITPEGVAGCALSPDDLTIIGYDLASATARLYPMDGGTSRAIPGFLPDDSFTWSSDPHVLYVYQGRQLPIRLYRLNILTGERQFFREFHPIDTTGLCHMTHVLLSGDGRAYVYSYTRMLSDLYLVKGLK
jgi:DNA-binding winged helix-turn-helix (wHTH) protein/Tol biopolymer transport system component